ELELLHSLSGIDLGRVDITLGVNRDGMHPVKLTGVAAVAAEAADHGAVFAVENPDLVVLAVRAEQIGLLRIGPDREIPHRAIAERIFLVEPFLDEAAVLFEHLDAVVDAIADIDQAVIGDLHAMHGIAELLRNRGLGIIGGLLLVVRPVAIGAPVPLVGAGGG